jgi:hypothetical protein
LETSAYLYLDEANVRKDLIADGYISYNQEKSDFHWVDLFAAGPAPLTTWTSSYTDQGVMGAAELATKEKGMITDFRKRPASPRRDHHAKQPTMDMPWHQDQGNCPGAR